jgi:hypothetical protein
MHNSSPQAAGPEAFAHLTLRNTKEVFKVPPRANWARKGGGLWPLTCSGDPEVILAAVETYLFSPGSLLWIATLWSLILKLGVGVGLREGDGKGYFLQMPFFQSTSE